MRVVEPVPEKLWNDVAAACGHATFFHTHAWAKALEKTYPQFRIAARAFHFGGDDWAVFPWMRASAGLKGFFRYGVSNEPGVYGGPIFNHAAPPERVRAVAESLPDLRTAGFEIGGNPLAGAWPDLPGFQKRPNFTHLLELSKFADIEELGKRYDRSTRKAIRDAVSGRVECVVLEDDAGLKKYYSVYEKELEMWGSKATNRYPYELFRNLFELRGGGVRFWAAKVYGEVAGGVVSCRQNGHFVLWHAAWLPLGLEMGASKYLYHRIIERAMADGVRIFDFNPSGGHAGTIRMKESFGCEKREFCGYVHPGGGAWKLYSKLARRG